MGRWRWIWGSQRCGPKLTLNSKTSEGKADQMGTPLRQGVRRAPAILVRKALEIRRAMRTFPSSGGSNLELMLVKWLWCGRRNSCSETFFSRQIVRDEPRRMVNGAFLKTQSAETLLYVADPYKGKTPLPRVPNYQEPFASRHPNTWKARANQYLEQSPETHNHRIHSIERPHPQSAGTTKSQRRVGTRKRPKKKPKN